VEVPPKAVAQEILERVSQSVVDYRLPRSRSGRLGARKGMLAPDQTTEPQRLELHDYCNRRGWPIAAEYTDTVSGAKFTRTGSTGSWQVCANSGLT
jgi:hypothetical protein